MMDTASTAASTAAAPVILCVDDEPNILSSLRRLFRAQGYDVRTAESGAAGLRVLESEAVDIVISDMRMPEMDGAHFLRQARARWPDAVRVLLTGHSDTHSVVDAVNQGEIHRYITKPWDDHDLLLSVRLGLERKHLEREKRDLEILTQTQNDALRNLNANLEVKVAERTVALETANGALLQANGRLKAGFVTTLKVFSTLLEMRGGKLAGHARRVAYMARKIALKMGLEEEHVQQVFVAGLLHEIGKLGFPDDLLHAPVATMGASQLAEYRTHATRAENLLMPLPDLRDAALSIGGQLERFDGQGYPQKRHGESIPLGARILAVAADHDSLQIGAVVQHHFPPEEATAAILRGSGKRYDPRVIAALVAVLGGDASEEATQPQTAEVALDAVSLKPGMTLSRDLVAPNGMLMLAAEHALDEHLIQKILDFEKAGGAWLTIFVYQHP